MTVGERLRQARIEAGLTIYKMAKLVGLHQTTIAKHETGEGKIDLLTLEKYADALDVSPAWLAGFDTTEPPQRDVESLRRAARMVDMCADVMCKTIRELQDELREFLMMLEEK